MAVPYLGHLRARLRAQYHIQIERDDRPKEIQGYLRVPISGTVVRIFRRHGPLSIGDRMTFSVEVLAPGGTPRPGPGCMPSSMYLNCRYFEAYLNGTPPDCQLALNECVGLAEFSSGPALTVSWLEYFLEWVKWPRRWR